MHIEDKPNGEDIQFLRDCIYQHNIARTGHNDGQELAIFVREDGQIVAGLYGWTWAGWLEVNLVWVHADRRGQGLGRQMLLAAEHEARARGCQRVFLDSYGFQAPEFYKKFGYQVFGVLEGFPAPHNRYFFTKSLV